MFEYDLRKKYLSSKSAFHPSVFTNVFNPPKVHGCTSLLASILLGLHYGSAMGRLSDEVTDHAL